MSSRRVVPGWVPIVHGYTCGRYPCFVLSVPLGCGCVLLPPAAIVSCVQMASSLISGTGAQLGPEPLCLAVMAPGL